MIREGNWSNWTPVLVGIGIGALVLMLMAVVDRYF